MGDVTGSRGDVDPHPTADDPAGRSGGAARPGDGSTGALPGGTSRVQPDDVPATRPVDGPRPHTGSHRPAHAPGRDVRWNGVEFVAAGAQHAAPTPTAQNPADPPFRLSDLFAPIRRSPHATRPERGFQPAAAPGPDPGGEPPQATEPERVNGPDGRHGPGPDGHHGPGPDGHHGLDIDTREYSLASPGPRPPFGSPALLPAPAPTPAPVPASGPPGAIPGLESTAVAPAARTPAQAPAPRPEMPIGLLEAGRRTFRVLPPPARRGRPPKPPRIPPVGLSCLVVLALLAAFFGWVSVEPFWISVGHARSGTATIERCTGAGVSRRCAASFQATDGRFSTRLVAVAGGGQLRPGARVGARMVSPHGRLAYVGDAGGLHLRWIIGLLLVLLCGLLIAWLTGTYRLPNRRARLIAFGISVGTPMLLAAGMAATAW